MEQPRRSSQDAVVNGPTQDQNGGEKLSDVVDVDRICGYESYQLIRMAMALRKGIENYNDRRKVFRHARNQPLRATMTFQITPPPPSPRD